MGLFIGGLALSGALLDAAKLGVMIGSALSAVVGMVLILGLRAPEFRGGHPCARRDRNRLVPAAWDLARPGISPPHPPGHQRRRR